MPKQVFYIKPDNDSNYKIDLKNGCELSIVLETGKVITISTFYKNQLMIVGTNTSTINVCNATMDKSDYNFSTPIHLYFED